MAKTYFSQYIDDIDRILRVAWERQATASNALEGIKKTANETISKNRIGSVDRLIAEKQLQEAEDAYRKTMTAIQNDVERELTALRQSRAKHIAEYVAADPGQVDQSTVVLLNSGALSDGDLMALADRFWNSPTMLKLISGEAQKRLNDSRTARLLAQRIAEYVRPDSRLRVFDDAVGIARRTIRSDHRLAVVFQREWDGGFYTSLREAMGQLDTFGMEAV